jgi:hypothetical protein
MDPAVLYDSRVHLPVVGSRMRPVRRPHWLRVGPVGATRQDRFELWSTHAGG